MRFKHVTYTNYTVLKMNIFKGIFITVYQVRYRYYFTNSTVLKNFFCRVTVINLYVLYFGCNWLIFIDYYRSWNNFIGFLCPPEIVVTEKETKIQSEVVLVKIL
jgi:hypothetical protein